MSKFKYIIPTSLISGGMVLGAIFSPISLSSAQSDGSAGDGADPTTVPAPESNRNTDVDKPGEGGRHGRPGQHRRGGFGKEALEELGLTADDLKAGHEAGQSLAETAAAAGISEEDLVDALITGAQDRLDTAAEDGRIDDGRLAEIEGHLEERISNMVNRTPGERGDREGGRPGGRPDRSVGRPGNTGGDAKEAALTTQVSPHRTVIASAGLVGAVTRRAVAWSV